MPQMRCPKNMPKMPLLGVKNVIFTAACSFKYLIISMWKKSRNPCPADACLHLRDSRAFFPFMQHVPPVDATRSAGRCDVPRRLVWRVASFCVRRYVKKKLLIAPVRVPVSLCVLPQCLPAGLLFQLPDGEGEVGVGEWFVAEREVPPLGVQRLKAAFEHGFTQNHAVAELLLGDAAASG